jgi:hypothetical protein
MEHKKLWICWRRITPPRRPSPCPPRQMDEHVPGMSTRRGARSCPTTEYRQTTRRMAEYRLVGGGTTKCRQLAGGLARGGAGGDKAMRGEGGICNEKVGFACSLTDRTRPSPLFSHPESPSAPRGGWPGLSGWIKGLFWGKTRNRGRGWAK